MKVRRRRCPKPAGVKVPGYSAFSPHVTGGAMMPRVSSRSAFLWLFTTRIWVLVTGLLLSTPSSLNAQFTSVIEGRVSDPSDASVPNSEVTVENLATGVKRVVRASELGYY